MTVPKLVIGEVALAVARNAAAEWHPKEAIGLLFGHETRSRIYVNAVVPLGNIEKRTRWGVETSDELDDLYSTFEHVSVGGFHSHTNGVPSMSDADREELKEGDWGSVELVVSVWPGKRKPWRFLEKAYHCDSKGRIRRMKIEVKS